MRVFALLTLCASLALLFASTPHSSQPSPRPRVFHPAPALFRVLPCASKPSTVATPSRTGATHPPEAGRYAEVFDRLSHGGQNQARDLRDLLRMGLQDRVAFDEATRLHRDLLFENERFPGWLLVARGLVLGPRANISLPQPVGETSRRGYLVSLGAHRLDEGITEEQLENVSAWIAVMLPPPSSCRMDDQCGWDPPLSARFSFDKKVAFAIGRVSDPIALDEAIRVSGSNSSTIALALRVVLPGDDPRVQTLVADVLQMEPFSDVPHLFDGVIACLADASVETQARLLKIAWVTRLPVSSRGRIVWLIGHVARDKVIPQLARFFESPDAEIRMSVLEGLCNAPDGILPAALIEAERGLRGERIPSLRADMIACVPRHWSEANRRVAILRDLATSDPDPSCREAAQRGVDSLDFMNLGVDWSEGVSSPEASQAQTQPATR